MTDNAHTYLINEIFYSLQGEGVLAGTPMMFIRFSKCNMQCAIEAGPKSPGGFDCDTEFESGTRMSLEQISNVMREVCPVALSKVQWMLLTGGEPALQVDKAFIKYFSASWLLAIETNGSKELPFIDQPGECLDRFALDHICVSPKVAEHAIKQLFAHEVKYVRGYGQAIPKTVVNANHYLISPATDGTSFDDATIAWCVELVKTNPKWRLTVQFHKLWKAR